MPKAGDAFPHFTVNIDDQSRRPLPAPAPPGLHQPVFFVFAERGPINVPTKGSYAYLKEIFGEATFVTKSKYFQHPSLFARTACQYQEIWLVRLADDTAERGSLVLEASVVDKDITQYQKAADGTRLLDENGDWIPELEVDEVTEVTEPGIRITWSTRAIDYDGGETLTNMASSTTVDGDGDTVTTYPILALEADAVSGAGNNLGVKFYYDPEYETSVVDNISAMTYRFDPVRLNELTNIAEPLRDIFTAPGIDVALKADAQDPDTAQYYDLEERIRRQYTSTDGNAPYSLIGMTANAFDVNAKTITDRGLAKSTELTGTPSEQINFVTGIGSDGVEYDHIEVTNAADFVNKDRVNYLTGGSDGDITAASLELLTQDYLGGTAYPEVKDGARYPFTHVYDSGYTMATKLALIDFMGLRDDIKVDITTQDVTNEANTASEDQSAGSALRAAALLHPESTFFGTSVIRCSIWQQCGILTNDPFYRTIVPLLLDRMAKRCQYDSTQKVKGQPTGLPNSAVTIFTDINWTPSTDDQKRLNETTALNWVQHYNTSSVHYADYRSVYPYNNSVLSDDIAVDYLVYLKHICRQVWAQFVGLRQKPEVLFQTIEDTVDARCHNAFDGRLVTDTTVYRTAEDEARGFSSTVQVRVKLPTTNRVLTFNVEVDRLS